MKIPGKKESTKSSNNNISNGPSHQYHHEPFKDGFETKIDVVAVAAAERNQESNAFAQKTNVFSISEIIDKRCMTDDRCNVQFKLEMGQQHAIDGIAKPGKQQQQHDGKFHLTRKHIYTIVCLAYGNFCLGAMYSLQAPFFPREAESKGATSSQIGLIFSSYEFGVFILSPLFGKFMKHFRLRFMITTGLFIVGVCCVLFGFLRWSPHGTTFVALSFTLSICQSFGGAAFFTACYTIIAVEFPDKVSHFFATAEMFFGFGMIVGPAFGGFLFEIGNFNLPYFVMGSLLLVAWFVSIILLPESTHIAASSGKVNLFAALCNIGISLNILISVNCFFLIGFNDATLEHHIREVLNLSPSTTGVIFLVGGVLYAIGNQIWAFFAEKVENAHSLCFIALVAGLLCFVFSGPVYGIQLETSLWTIIVSQIFLGISMGGQLVGSFTEGLKESAKCGHVASAASLFSSAFSLGASVGPSAGGILMEHYGYTKACIFVIVLQLFMMCLLIVYNMFRQSNVSGHLDLNPYYLSRKSIDTASGTWANFDPNILGKRIVARGIM